MVRTSIALNACTAVLVGATGCVLDDAGEGQNIESAAEEVRVEPGAFSADNIIFTYAEGSGYIEVEIAMDGTELGGGASGTVVRVVRARWTLPDGTRGVAELDLLSGNAVKPRNNTILLPMIGDGTYSVQVQELLTEHGDALEVPMIEGSMTLYYGSENARQGGSKDAIGGDGSDVDVGSYTPSACVAGAVIIGGPGNDVLAGTPNNDVLDGLGGDDILRAGACHDRLYGREGADTAYGGGGNDRISGGSGRDTLHGHGGNDRISGGPDSDVLCGHDGDDYLHGGTGFDVCSPGPGIADVLVSCELIVANCP